MQRNPLTSYIIKLSIFSIAICFIGFISLLFFKNYISLNLPYYILLFYLCTGLSYIYTYLSLKKKKMRFENVFMITKFGKLFIYIIVFLIIIFLKKENPIPLTITYLSLYVLYLIFDTITLRNFSQKIK
ncbi:MAG: hypothetical protein PHY75_04135 [Bacteroidales bacterium]|nr:hypothetical protein [Bacteroidales bacterium]